MFSNVSTWRISYKKQGKCLPFASTWIHPWLLVVSVLLIFFNLLCCVVFFVLFVFVLCLVCPMLSVSLDCLYLSCVSNVASVFGLFVFVLCPMLPVSLDCSFLIVPSVFSNNDFYQQYQ